MKIGIERRRKNKAGQLTKEENRTEESQHKTQNEDYEQEKIGTQYRKVKVKKLLITILKNEGRKRKVKEKKIIINIYKTGKNILNKKEILKNNK